MKRKKIFPAVVLLLISAAFLPRCTLSSTEYLEIIERPTIEVDSIEVPGWEIKEE